MKRLVNIVIMQLVVSSCLLSQDCKAGTSLAVAESNRTEGKLVIIEKGVSKAPVIIPKETPPRTLQVIDEFVSTMEEISGAKMNVISGMPDNIPEKAVWLGYQPGMEKLFLNVDFALNNPEEILITANQNHLAILGRDCWNPDFMKGITKNGDELDGIQQEYGTVNAIYTFLRDCMEVRWLWPGETGLDIIRKETVAFSPFEYRYHPQMRERSQMFRFTDPTWGKTPYAEDWVRRQRLQLDSMEAPIMGHAFKDWWDRFNETHPEYFAMQLNGERDGYPNPKMAKLCQSNPAVWDQWLEDVKDQLKENPNQTMFSASPNDSWLSGHCLCEKCKAWDDPSGELRRFISSGGSIEYVALSDRLVKFLNQLGRKLKEAFPDKDYKVVSMAYGHTRPAPIKAVPDDNVIIAPVACFFGYRGPDLVDWGSLYSKTTHIDQFTGWSKVKQPVLWRPNTGGDGGWFLGGHLVPLQKTMRDFRFVADAGCIGMCVDSIHMHYSTQGPAYYLMAHLAWDPYADGNATMEDYWRRAFGPAAKSVKAFFAVVEDNNGVSDVELVSFKENGKTIKRQVAAFKPELLEQMTEILDNAASAVEGAEDKYKQRIMFIRTGLDYVKLLKENNDLAMKYRESEGKDETAVEQALKNWKIIGQMSIDFPYAINWKRISTRSDIGRVGWANPGGRLNVDLPVTEKNRETNIRIK